MRIAVVTTTINVPNLLVGYAKNFEKFGWKRSDVFFVVAGDKKTPPLSEFCSSLYSKYGYRAEYLGIKEQGELHPGLKDYIPYNTITRRNFAILKAYTDGADIIVTIDDDNLVNPENDYLRLHSIVGKETQMVHVSSDSGWYDVCRTLSEKENKQFYHRGFPMDRRMNSKNDKKVRNTHVIASAGLWLDAPDTDAIAWLNFGSMEVTGFDAKQYGSQFALEKGTWCPFNSQNTALAREVIPAYFLNPPQQRYDDIWASYMVRKISDHMGHSVSYGEPLVTQKRNPHSYIKDLRNELDGMARTPGLIKELREMDLTQNNYIDSTYEVTEKLSSKYEDLKQGYGKWLSAIEGSK